jgi:hypothetical protein
MVGLPLLIEFVAGTRLVREQAVTPKLPIVDNGPPGTFVIFASGRKVPLPTDYVIAGDDAQGAARVQFGGMRFDGVQDGMLVFTRKERRMTLEPDMVSAVLVDGKPVWP